MKNLLVLGLYDYENGAFRSYEKELRKPERKEIFLRATKEYFEGIKNYNETHKLPKYMPYWDMIYEILTQSDNFSDEVLIYPLQNSKESFEKNEKSIGELCESAKGKKRLVVINERHNFMLPFFIAMESSYDAAFVFDRHLDIAEKGKNYTYESFLGNGRLDHKKFYLCGHDLTLESRMFSGRGPQQFKIAGSLGLHICLADDIVEDAYGNIRSAEIKELLVKKGGSGQLPKGINIFYKDAPKTFGDAFKHAALVAYLLLRHDQGVDAKNCLIFGEKLHDMLEGIVNEGEHVAFDQDVDAYKGVPWEPENTTPRVDIKELEACLDVFSRKKAVFPLLGFSEINYDNYKKVYQEVIKPTLDHLT